MKRVVASFACGLILTVILTGFGLSQDSRPALCVFIWQACLVQLVIHTPDNSIHEGSPIDLFGFSLGVLLGVPLYSLISYGFLKVYARVKNQGRE
jgi:hypothetical protein